MEDEQQLEPRWRVGLIGDPVAHSYSPRFQQAALDALGIPARYELWQTPSNELAARVASLLAPRCMGANITIPYKEAVLPLLDVVDPLAARIGAVNTIVHRDEYLYGYNTDAAGLLLALVEQGVGTPSRRGGGGVDAGRGRLRRPTGWGDVVNVQDAGDASVPSPHNPTPAPTGWGDVVNVQDAGDASVPSPHNPTPAPTGWGDVVNVQDAGDASVPSPHNPTPAPTGFGALMDSFSLRGYTAVLLGAAFALVAASIDRLIIVNRNLERAQRLAADVQQGSDCQVFSLSDPDFLIPHPSSLIINATPVGMYVANEQGRGKEEVEQVSPLPVEVLARFAADTFVFDMIYHPIQTQLLCQARMLGLRAANGLPMLLHQGALAFSLWTGQAAPLEVMRAALRRFL